MQESTKQSAWREWLESPVTQVRRAGLARALAAQRDQMLQAYWRGQPVAEADRLALRRVEEWAEDFFSASVEDFEATMRGLDEYERHTGGGIQRFGSAG